MRARWRSAPSALRMLHMPGFGRGEEPRQPLPVSGMSGWSFQNYATALTRPWWLGV